MATLFTQTVDLRPSCAVRLRKPPEKGRDNVSVRSYECLINSLRLADFACALTVAINDVNPETIFGGRVWEPKTLSKTE